MDRHPSSYWCAPPPPSSLSPFLPLSLPAFLPPFLPPSLSPSLHPSLPHSLHLPLKPPPPALPPPSCPFLPDIEERCLPAPRNPSTAGRHWRRMRAATITHGVDIARATWPSESARATCAPTLRSLAPSLPRSLSTAQGRHAPDACSGARVAMKCIRECFQALASIATGSRPGAMPEARARPHRGSGFQ